MNYKEVKEQVTFIIWEGKYLEKSDDTIAEEVLIFLDSIGYDNQERDEVSSNTAKTD